MTELPPMPTDPADLEAWVASLRREDLMALAQGVTSGALTRGAAREALIRRNAPIDLPPPPAEPTMLTLTIELREAKPRIWRRLVLPGDLTLDKVHILFQAAMGWSDSHLHRFEPGHGRGPNRPYFITEYDEQEGDEGTREWQVRLDQVLCAPGDRVTYLYDFGDGWEHLVKLESRAPASDDAEPRCLGGANACPPEDVGGPYGHEQIASWLRAGAPADAVPEQFESAERVHEWLPPNYDPDAFDPDEATTAMREWAQGKHLPWYGLPDPLMKLLMIAQGPQATAWLALLGLREPEVLDKDDLIKASKPWVALLNAVGEQTKLTAAGYLPPALVHQLAQDLGITRWWIGKANREDMLWPLAELRLSAQDLGLLRKAKGVLKPTARAQAVTDDPHRLVTTVLGRLPMGRGFDAEAGWFGLLGLAAGVAGAELDAGVAQMLNDRGWRASDRSPVNRADAQAGWEATASTLAWMAGDFKNVDPGLRTRLARAVLFGVAQPV